MPAAALMVHQLRYWLAFGPDAAHELSEQGHSYLSSLAPWIVLVSALALGGFVGRVARAWSDGRPDTDRAPRLRVWALAAVALIAIHTGQELLEGWFAAGHPAGLDAVLGNGGWVATPLALAVAGAVAVGLYAADAIVGRVARARRRAAAAVRGGNGEARPPNLVSLWPLSPLASAAPGRAPPLGV
jgi:hypothetical protein